MKTTRFLAFLLLACAVVIGTTASRKVSSFRLLYWNIQNGMWDGQPNLRRMVEITLSSTGMSIKSEQSEI